MPARVTIDELPQSLQGLPCRFLGPPGVVEGHIVHRDAQRQTLPAGGRVADLDQGGGSTREAPGKGKHPRRRGVVLKADLQRRLVGQRSGIYEKTVCQPRRAARFPKQELGKLDHLGAELQIPLHHRVADRCFERPGHEIRITVAEHVHADAADHVPLDRAVGELDERPAAETRADIGVPWGPALDRLLPRQVPLIGFRQLSNRPTDTRDRLLGAFQLLDDHLDRRGDRCGLGEIDRGRNFAGARAHEPPPTPGMRGF